MNSAKWGRLLALAVTGGFLFQVGGCSSTLTPLFLSLAEQIILSALFSGVTGVA